MPYATTQTATITKRCIQYFNGITFKKHAADDVHCCDFSDQQLNKHSPKDAHG
jgi:hypothetical protein